MAPKIDVLNPSDPRVARLRELLLQTPPFVAHGAIFFGEDRWLCVEAVAVLNLSGIDAGLATLAPTDEDGQGGPTVVALWIDPEVGEPQRSKLGASLLGRLSEEAIKLWGKAPHLLVITQTELHAAEIAKAQGVALTFEGNPAWQW